MLFVYGQYTYTIVRCTERLTSNGTSGSLLLVTFFAWTFKMTFGSHAANVPASLRVEHESGKCSHCCVMSDEPRLGGFWSTLLGFDRRRNPCKSQTDTFYHVEFFSLPPTAATTTKHRKQLVCEHTGSPSNDGILKNLTCVNKYISLHITLERNFKPKKTLFWCVINY